MAIHRLLTAAVAVGMVAVPTATPAAFVLGNQIYPDYRKAELRAACQGLEAKSRESLTAEFNVDEESNDPASAYYLAHVTFTLRDCEEAGLL
ncbi:hypothetical protein [Devosia sp.]|uniref:hypothetical protein n=1 Tax=Devosia sp. TaxID=1871048 RepID=UPI002EEC7C1A